MSDAAVEDWRELADDLEAHGVPRRQAEVVALRASGRTYADIAAELGFGSDNDDRSQVKRHLDSYEERLEDSRWLAENAPEV